MRTYWIIKTHKWKVETDDPRVLEDDTIEIITANTPDWSDLKVVEDEQVPMDNLFHGSSQQDE